MATSLGEYALGIILDLVNGAIKKTVSDSVQDFFERRKIQRRVEDAVATVVEPLIPFLAHEGVSEEKAISLITDLCR